MHTCPFLCARAWAVDNVVQKHANSMNIYRNQNMPNSHLWHPRGPVGIFIMQVIHHATVNALIRCVASQHVST